MKYAIRGCLFDKQTKEPLSIPPEIIVSGYDEAFDLIRGVGYKHYIIALDEIQKKEK